MWPNFVYLCVSVSLSPIFLMIKNTTWPRDPCDPVAQKQNVTQNYLMWPTWPKWPCGPMKKGCGGIGGIYDEKNRVAIVFGMCQNPISWFCPSRGPVNAKNWFLFSAQSPISNYAKKSFVLPILADFSVWWRETSLLCGVKTIQCVSKVSNLVQPKSRIGDLI